MHDADDKPFGLSELVKLGSSSESEQGIALRSIQMGIAMRLCDVLGKMQNSMNTTLSYLAQVEQQWGEMFQEALPDMDRTELEKYMEMLSSRVYRLMELERKLISARELFPSDSMSEDDRKVMRLLSSLRSPAERARFIQLIDREFPTDVEEVVYEDAQ